MHPRTSLIVDVWSGEVIFYLCHCAKSCFVLKLLKNVYNYFPLIWPKKHWRLNSKLKQIAPLSHKFNLLKIWKLFFTTYPTQDGIHPKLTTMIKMVAVGTGKQWKYHDGPYYKWAMRSWDLFKGTLIRYRGTEKEIPGTPQDSNPGTCLRTYFWWKLKT